ncbi:DNA-binding domain-containing protein [Pontixanthobacter gangjinensis]|nr:DNA-binding domain-containing protein [Pontixanthobacter gangjinensis]
MNLARQQQEFMAQVLEDELPLPAGWTSRQVAGMDIYRNAYRARLVDALRDTYGRTARWVGEDAFRKAAAHHVISHPPKSWTLDDAGEGFTDTLAELFANDPEVAELGWLEWAMHRCFVAADAVPVDAAGFGDAAALFQEEDWANMRLTFLPGTGQITVKHDIGKLWRCLAAEGEAATDFTLPNPLHCVVWREGVKPVFMQVDEAEGLALAAMRDGGTYGEMCELLIAVLGEEQAITQAGAILGRWLHNGLIASLSK